MQRCPKCDSGETLNIRFMGHDGVVAYAEVQQKKILPKYSKIRARACAKCGYIFNFTLINPENLAQFVTLE